MPLCLRNTKIYRFHSHFHTCTAALPCDEHQQQAELVVLLVQTGRISAACSSRGCRGPGVCGRVAGTALRVQGRSVGQVPAAPLAGAHACLPPLTQRTSRAACVCGILMQHAALAPGADRVLFLDRMQVGMCFSWKTIVIVTTIGLRDFSCPYERRHGCEGGALCSLYVVPKLK